MRPSLSEREKGAKGRLGTWRTGEDSGGPQPSGLKGTGPTSKDMAARRDGRLGFAETQRGGGGVGELGKETGKRG